MRIALRVIIVTGLCLCGRTSAHDVPVHRAVTGNAIASAFSTSSGFSGFIDLVSSNITFLNASNYIVEGSAREDDPVGSFPTDSGGYRSLNHFYDPIYSNYGRGLSDSPFLLVLGGDSRELLGTNSFAWASISNCVGIKTLLYSQYPTNTYSWQNARSYEWLGLTATNKDDRFENLTNMFRAVGQVMHLLEDASQPQHVRNE